ncbi:metallophosphoesterase [Roseimicrobium sp. ORNL1]|uniref:metallophosphoesterase n=1 Tax=Roseimicrobium sp. ORNL1 TaxID=2711231 RepID=UPI0013E10C73|nr:metallophosphoesterase [Roseimicrobium sp. ORNL1]QIF03793.1 hypothetical protein G5S37_20460 [Roseimicrobium sp. ORNL1]
MKEKCYDLIGDIHGHYDKVTALLLALGYMPTETTWKHAERRKVIFLGDYIDRGPKIRETLQLVRGMVEAGDARAIIGNHEFNALCFATPDGNGGYLRQRTEKNINQHAKTLEAFDGREEEWRDWLRWFRELPVYLDLGDLRAVHATWDERFVDLLRGAPLADEAFFKAACTDGTPENMAVVMLLKGPEMPLPEGFHLVDKEGHAHTKTRVRWWGLGGDEMLGDLVMPRAVPEFAVRVPAENLADVPNYAADAPPVFFGHYWLPPDAPKEPLAPNIVCLDFAAALGENPLWAYRWDGEANVRATKFVCADRA